MLQVLGWKLGDLEKKQNAVARSGAKVEFWAVAQGLCALLWLKIIFNDLQARCEEPMNLYYVINPVQQHRTKHIEIDQIEFYQDFS